MAADTNYINLLGQELITRVQSVPAYRTAGFSCFNELDFKAKVSSHGNDLPCFGVQYDGSTPVDNRVISAAPMQMSKGVALLVMQFTIVVATQYQYTNQEDSKPSVHDLLDETRRVVEGYAETNKRPWVFLVESPVDEDSGDGLIFYRQVWRTTVPFASAPN